MKLKVISIITKYMQFILLFGPWQSSNGEYSLGRIRVVSIQCDLVKIAVTGGSLRHIASGTFQLPLGMGKRCS